MFTPQSEASQRLEAISDIVLKNESATKCQKCDSPCLRDQGKAASV